MIDMNKPTYNWGGHHLTHGIWVTIGDPKSSCGPYACGFRYHVPRQKPQPQLWLSKKMLSRTSTTHTGLFKKNC